MSLFLSYQTGYPVLQMIKLGTVLESLIWLRRFRFYSRVFHETLWRGKNRRWWPWQQDPDPDPVFPFLWFLPCSKKITIHRLLKYFITVLTKPNAFISLTNKFYDWSSSNPLLLPTRSSHTREEFTAASRGHGVWWYRNQPCSLNRLSLTASNF